MIVYWTSNDGKQSVPLGDSESLCFAITIGLLSKAIQLFLDGDYTEANCASKLAWRIAQWLDRNNHISDGEMEIFLHLYSNTMYARTVLKFEREPPFDDADLLVSVHDTADPSNN